MMVIDLYMFMVMVIWSCYNLPVISGQSQVIGSSQSVMALVGDDVILPCHVEPSDMKEKTVEWTRPDLKPDLVHMLQQGRVITDQLNPLYNNRTSLFPDQFSHGNISLKLTSVKHSDEGKYKCFVPGPDKSSEIQLHVGSVSQPVISVLGKKGNLLSWRCDSGCWFPEPQVSWLDSDGNNMKAEPSVTDKPSDRCYVVQRTVTVALTEHVTCRVHLPHINHTVVIQGSVSQPVISLTGIKGDLLSWRCDSGCWFPEPKMSWLDSDGNNITAEPSVTEKPSDHCYVVQRNVTVKRGGYVTCRVHLPHINHTAETHSVITEDVIPTEDQPNQQGLIAFILLPVALLMSGYSCCRERRFRRTQQCRQNSSNTGPGENAPLIQSSTQAVVSSAPPPAQAADDKTSSEREKARFVIKHKATIIGSVSSDKVMDIVAMVIPPQWHDTFDDKMTSEEKMKELYFKMMIPDTIEEQNIRAKLYDALASHEGELLEMLEHPPEQGAVGGSPSERTETHDKLHPAEENLADKDLSEENLTELQKFSVK